MKTAQPYSINTHIRFNPLELIDVKKLQLETRDQWVNQMHRTRAPVRSVILMIEGKGVVPTGD